MNETISTKAESQNYWEDEGAPQQAGSASNSVARSLPSTISTRGSITVRNYSHFDFDTELRLREKAIEFTIKAYGHQDVNIDDFMNTLETIYGFLLNGSNIETNPNHWVNTVYTTSPNMTGVAGVDTTTL